MTDTPAADTVAPFDYTPALATLAPETKEFFAKKGWDKPSEDGKPADVLGRMTTSYRELESMIGNKNLIEPPRLDDDKAFGEWPGHKLLGAVEKPGDFKFDKPHLPAGQEWGKDGLEWDQAAEDGFRAAAAKAKIGQKQAGILFNELATGRMGAMLQGGAAQKAAAAALDAEMRTAWGAGYDANKQLATTAATYMATQSGLDENAVKDAVSRAMGDATAVRFFHKLGTMMSEDTLKGGRQAGFAAGPEAAKAELKELQANSDFVASLTDPRHAGHKANNERRNNLFKIAYPDG